MSRSDHTRTRASAAAFDFDVVSDVRPLPSRKPDSAPPAPPVSESAPDTAKMAEASGGH